MKNTVFILLLLFSTLVGWGQQAGLRTYSFLQVPTNPVHAAMGGQLISARSGLNAINDNPALLDSTRHNVSFNYTNYVSDINGGSFFFHPHEKWKNTAFGVQYWNYGTFLQTNVSGDILGEFTANDVALSAYHSRKLSDKLTLGATVRGVASFFPQSQSAGLGVDIGAYYQTEEENWTFGMVVRNIGYQFLSYTNTRERFPFEVQLGASKRIAKAPFRLHFLAHNLQTWDLTYQDESTQELDPITGEPIDPLFTFDKLLRHFSGGISFEPSKSFQMRFGYHHQRRQSLAVENRGGFAGFSLGAGIRFNRFSIDYGVTGYHLGASLHLFSINTKI